MKPEPSASISLKSLAMFRSDTPRAERSRAVNSSRVILSSSSVSNSCRRDDTSRETCIPLSNVCTFGRNNGYFTMCRWVGGFVKKKKARTQSGKFAFYQISRDKNNFSVTLHKHQSCLSKTTFDITPGRTTPCSPATDTHCLLDIIQASLKAASVLPTVLLLLLRLSAKRRCQIKTRQGCLA